MSKYIVLYEHSKVVFSDMAGVSVPQRIAYSKFEKFDVLEGALEFMSNNGGVLLKTVSLQEQPNDPHQ